MSFARRATGWFVPSCEAGWCGERRAGCLVGDSGMTARPRAAAVRAWVRAGAGAGAEAGSGAEGFRAVMAMASYSYERSRMGRGHGAGAAGALGPAGLRRALAGTLHLLSRLG
ncbi:hypothetical protein CF54_28390 [Streptomyces sp. Tu 6176]|nr:hypothetical protein CF54_28390 [Streptomyces sp. Tu 6176]